MTAEELSNNLATFLHAQQGQDKASNAEMRKHYEQVKLLAASIILDGLREEIRMEFQNGKSA